VKSILDPAFQYIPSVETDVRKTFARIWLELRAREKAEAASGQPGISPHPERTMAPVGIVPDGVFMVRESVPGMDVVTPHWSAIEEIESTSVPK